MLDGFKSGFPLIDSFGLIEEMPPFPLEAAGAPEPFLTFDRELAIRAVRGLGDRGFPGELFGIVGKPPESALAAKGERRLPDFFGLSPEDFFRIAARTLHDFDE